MVIDLLAILCYITACIIHGSYRTVKFFIYVAVKCQWPRSFGPLKQRYELFNNHMFSYKTYYTCFSYKTYHNDYLISQTNIKYTI